MSNVWIPMAVRALKADLAAPQVPREPTATAEMCLAGIGAYHRHYWPDLSPTEHTWESPTIMCMAKIWRAMYDAAPAQPDSSERVDIAEAQANLSPQTAALYQRAMQERNAIIEECAKVCDETEYISSSPAINTGCRICAERIRALKREAK